MTYEELLLSIMRGEGDPEQNAGIAWDIFGIHIVTEQPEEEDLK